MRQINTKAKMRRSNAKVRIFLEGLGYKVFIKLHIRFHDTDIFNLFDGLAVSKCGHEDLPPFFLFQIKSNRYPTLEPFKKFSSENNFPCVIFNVIDRLGLDYKVLK